MADPAQMISAIFAPECLPSKSGCCPLKRICFTCMEACPPDIDKNATVQPFNCASKMNIVWTANTTGKIKPTIKSTSYKCTFFSPYRLLSFIIKEEENGFTANSFLSISGTCHIKNTNDIHH